MAFPVLSLKALSLSAISTHIWHCWNLTPALMTIDLVAAASTCHPDPRTLLVRKAIPKTALAPFYSRSKPAYEAIMATETLLESVRAQVACAFIKLEKNMLDWAIDVVHILKDPQRKEDIIYCLAKTVVRPNLTVDRENTMFNVLFDSYGEVKLSRFGPGNICVLTVRNLRKFVFNSRYHQHGQLSRKIRMKLKRYKPIKYWHTSLKYCSLLGFEHTKSDLLMFAIKYTNLEVFENLLKKLSNQLFICLPTKLYTLLLSHAFLGGLSVVADLKLIIYLLEKLHERHKKVWLTFLTYWFCSIVQQVYHSLDPECSIMFFQIACDLVSPKSCASAVQQMLTDLRSYESVNASYHGVKAQYIKLRMVFLEIWNRTPVKVKQLLFDFLSDRSSFEYTYDYFLLSILFTDKAFTTSQTDFLILVKVLDMEDYQDEEGVKEFLSYLPSHYRDFTKNVPKATLRKYMMGCFRWRDFEGIRVVVKSEEDLITLKEELIQDKEFIVDTFVAAADFDVCEWIAEGLKWYLTTQDSIDRFIAEKVIGQNWMVDIMKKYLLAETYYDEHFDIINVVVTDTGERLRLKKLIREDLSLVLDALGKVFIPFNLFPCIFEPNQADEKRQLMELYLFSEKGKKAIEQYITYGENIKHFGLYKKRYLKQCIINMIYFKTYWLQPFHLTNKVIQYLCTVKIKGEAPIMFPHQTEEDAQLIMSINLNLFRFILRQNSAVDVLYKNCIAAVYWRAPFDTDIVDDLFL